MGSLIGIQPFIYTGNTTALSGGAGDTTVKINFASDSDFVLEEIRMTPHNAALLYMSIKRDDGYLFQSVYPKNATPLNKVDVSQVGAGANGLKLFPFTDPRGNRFTRIPANTSLSIDLTSTGAVAFFEIQLIGYKAEKSIQQNNPGLFCYAVRQVFTGAGALSPKIQFDNSSDFILQEIRQTVQTVNTVFIQLQNANGENWSNQVVDSSLFTTGNNKLICFPIVSIDGQYYPKIPAGSIVSVQIQSSGALTHEVQLWGFKSFNNGL